MEPLSIASDRQPTSPYGIVRQAQKALDAGAAQLIEAAAGANTLASPPPAPIAVAPREGSTIHVVA